MYQAVFFDLDGTLLPMDTDEFLSSYFASLSAYFTELGADARKVLAGVKAGTHAMMTYDEGATTNEQRFWDAFIAFMNESGAPETDWRARFDDYYRDAFPALGTGVVTKQHAAQAVRALADKGYRLVLATTPLFPPAATFARLSWTGVDPGVFERVTTYDNSHFAKPSADYYRENLAIAGLEGADVLMVGNDAVEDGAALTCGCDLFLVTDHLVERAEAALDPATPQGTMADFFAFAQSLPDVSR